MLCKVNVAMFRQFPALYCLSKLIIWLNHNVFLISLLFSIVSSLNHIHLPLFIIHKVNVAMFRQFPALYCLSKLIIWLNHDVFLISLLFCIVSSLNHIHLPLFMIHKVNVILFRHFLGFYCLSKLVIWLNQDVVFISLLFRIVSSLNQIHLLLFMIFKVNVILFRQFLGFHCLSKLIILLSHNVFLISLLFRIVSSLIHIHLPVFIIHKVNVILFRQFLGLYFLSKLILWLNHDGFLIS